jgi:hypothetical protein
MGQGVECSKGKCQAVGLLVSIPQCPKPPATLRHFASRTHDLSCTSAVLDDLRDSTIAGAAARSTAAVSAAVAP